MGKGKHRKRLLTKRDVALAALAFAFTLLAVFLTPTVNLAGEAVADFVDGMLHVQQDDQSDEPEYRDRCPDFDLESEKRLREDGCGCPCCEDSDGR